MVVAEAISRAKEVLIELFGAEGIDDLNLEEVALSKKGAEWLIAISFLRPVIDKQGGSLGLALASIRPRQKKLVRLNARDGSLVSVTDHFGTLKFEAA